MKESRRDISRWLLVSLVIALAIQLVGIKVVRSIDPYDSKEYLAISGSLFSGKGYGVSGTSFEGFDSFEGETPTRMRQPGYPFYLVVFYWLLGESILALQFSQVVLNSLTLCLMFLVVRRTFGQRPWGGTLLGLALYFPLWLTSAFVLTETLFVFLLVLSMLLLQRAFHSERKTHSAVSGAFFALAFLTRPIAFPIGFLTLLPISLRFGLRRALSHWAVLLVAFGVVVFPWFLRNGVSLGEYTPLSTDGGYNLWFASVRVDESKWFSSPAFREAVQNGYHIDGEADRRFKEAAMTNIKSDPRGYLKRGLLRVVSTWSYFPGSQAYRGNTLVFVLFSLAQFAILGFAIVGLCTMDRARAAYYLLPAISLSCVLVFTRGMSRFLVPAMPFVLVLSGHGFWLVWQRLLRITSPRRC